MVFLEKKKTPRVFSLMFTTGPKESNRKVPHEALKMTILCLGVEIPQGRLKLILTPDHAQPASLRLEIYSLGLFKKFQHVDSA